MTLALLVPLLVKVSIILFVLALGLDTQTADATYVIRHPWLLVRSIGAMNLLMPALVVAAMTLVDLEPAIRIALLALSVSPVPPLLPLKQGKAGGPAFYAVGLLVAAALLSVVLVPTEIEIIGRVVASDLHVPFGKVLRVVLLTVLVPLSVGIILRALQPRLSARLKKPVMITGAVLLLLAVVPIFITEWRLFRTLIGQGVIAGLALFSLVGLVVGHAAGGPTPEHRTVLALATSTRHPAIAMAIASINYPNVTAATAVVLFHVLIAAVVTLPYVIWRLRAHAARAAP